MVGVCVQKDQQGVEQLGNKEELTAVKATDINPYPKNSDTHDKAP